MNTEQERADFEAWAIKERIAYRDEKHGVCFYNGERNSYWIGYQAGRAALQSQDRERIIDSARSALNESFEVGDEYGSIGIPSDRAAYLSLLLDEYDHARRVEGDGE